jgi:hypothetical protein
MTASLQTSADGVTWTANPTLLPPDGQMSAPLYTPSGWFGGGLGESFWNHP